MSKGSNRERRKARFDRFFEQQSARAPEMLLGDVAALFVEVELQDLCAIELIHEGCSGLRESDNGHLIARAERAERAFADECDRSAELRSLLDAARDQIVRVRAEKIELLEEHIEALDTVARLSGTNMLTQTITHLDTRLGGL